MWDNRLFDRLMDLLDGFKEVRLNSARSDDLFDDVVEVSRTAANIKIRTQSESFKQLVFSQSAMYLLLAAVVFVVPVFSRDEGTPSLQVTTALMFVVGVCMGIVQTIPILQAANVAADNIERLEAQVAGDCRRTDSSRDRAAKRFEQNRDAQCRVPLRRQIVGGRLPGGTYRLHLAVRGARLHHRRQRVGQIDVPEAARGPV